MFLTLTSVSEYFNTAQWGMIGAILIIFVFLPESPCKSACGFSNGHMTLNAGYPLLRVARIKRQDRASRDYSVQEQRPRGRLRCETANCKFFARKSYRST